MASDDGSAGPVSAVVPDSTEQAKPPGLPTAGSRGSRRVVGRRLVPLLVALALAARTIGHGRWGVGVFLAIAIALVTIFVVRKARQL
jgi:hypothetical protein